MKARVVFLSSLILLASIGCGRIGIQLFEEKRFLMDTLVSITIYAHHEPDKWREQVAATFEAMQRIENLTSSYRDASEIGRINLRAGQAPLKVSPDVLEIVREAQEVSAMSQGAFDITILPLQRLWNFKSPEPVVPMVNAILEKRRFTDFRKIVIDDSTIFLPEKGMGMDLGGIAKGYAVDRAVDILKSMGYQDFLVAAGGDLRAISGPLTAGRRKIWVRHPRRRDSFFATITIDEGAVATSGDYEKYFEINGKRYHHILNPKTGYPSSPVVSVTIVAATTSLADAFATAAFVLGPERGMEFIENNPTVAGLIIFEQDAESVGTLKWKISTNLVNKIDIIGG
ncbi:MAG: FAD:protein FMN transferase [bacterium]